MLPGPMDGSIGSLQTDSRPPGSKERKRGINPSAVGTRSGANFENVASHRGFFKPRKKPRVSGLRARVCQWEIGSRA